MKSAVNNIGSSSKASAAPPPHKKRKAESPKAEHLRADLVTLRSLTSAVDPTHLKSFILSQIDNAMFTLPNPRSPIVLSQQPSMITTNSTVATTRATGDTTQGPPRNDDNHSDALTPLTPVNEELINALLLIFSKLSLDTPPSSPTRISAPTSAGNSSTRTMPSRSSDATSASPVTTVPPSVPKAAEAEVHCVRCHRDFLPSENKHGECFVEHDKENCVRVSKNGQTSSVWEYQCCKYKFKSPYSDEPEDPKENTDKGSYCFVGKHTTDESKDYSESMNTFPCDEAGCWEDASEDDASEEMVVDA